MLNNLHNAVFLLALLSAAIANPVTASSTNSTVSLPEGHHSPSFHGHHGGSHSHHAARGVTGKLHCGNFANANGQMAGNLVSALNAGSLKTHEYSVAAHGCNRVNCWDTSGVYVCNDNSHSISVTGAQVHAAAKIITNECCAYSQTGAENKGKIMAGQQFTQNGWNVIIGYANCNHPATQKPSDIGGWGVNGGTCKSWETSVTNG